MLLFLCFATLVLEPWIPGRFPAITGWLSYSFINNKHNIRKLFVHVTVFSFLNTWKQFTTRWQTTLLFSACPVLRQQSTRSLGLAPGQPFLSPTAFYILLCKGLTFSPVTDSWTPFQQMLQFLKNFKLSGSFLIAKNLPRSPCFIKLSSCGLPAISSSPPILSIRGTFNMLLCSLWCPAYFPSSLVCGFCSDHSVETILLRALKTAYYRNPVTVSWSPSRSNIWHAQLLGFSSWLPRHCANSVLLL